MAGAPWLLSTVVSLARLAFVGHIISNRSGRQLPRAYLRDNKYHTGCLGKVLREHEFISASILSITFR
jgi:hypothetical protein